MLLHELWSAQHKSRIMCALAVRIFMALTVNHQTINALAASSGQMAANTQQPGLCHQTCDSFSVFNLIETSHLVKDKMIPFPHSHDNINTL